MDGLRIFIVERKYHHDDKEHTGSLSSHLRVTSDGQCFLPVGFAYVRENWIPNYVKSQHHLPMPIIHSSTEIGGFLYLEVMVTDSRVGRLCRGAGAALIRGMREYGQGRGMKALWVDGWAGNERKLIRFVLFLFSLLLLFFKRFEVVGVNISVIGTMNSKGSGLSGIGVIPGRTMCRGWGR